MDAGARGASRGFAGLRGASRGFAGLRGASRGFGPGRAERSGWGAGGQVRIQARKHATDLAAREGGRRYVCQGGNQYSDRSGGREAVGGEVGVLSLDACVDGGEMDGEETDGEEMDGGEMDGGGEIGWVGACGE